MPSNRTETTEFTTAVTPPSETARTVISLLLVIHLTALAISVASNYQPTSVLRSRLSEAPLLPDYMRALHMDTAYNFYHTYGDLLDVDYFVEIEPTGGGEAAEPPTSLDTMSGLPVVCHPRYRNLILRMAIDVEPGNEERAGYLPQAVAERLMRERQIDSGRFRLRRRLLLTRDDYSLPDPAARDPYAAGLYQTVYEADVFFFDGKLRLNKVESAGQTAPIRKRQPRGAGASRASTAPAADTATSSEEKSSPRTPSPQKTSTPPPKRNSLAPDPKGP